MFDWVREKFAAPHLRPFSFGIGSERPAHTELSYKYDDMNRLMEDERIYSIVSLCASIAKNSYKGIEILPRDIFKDDELSESEKKAVNEAEKFTRMINIKDLFFTFAWNILAYGDYVERIISNKDGITHLEPLPMNNLTVIESKDQLNLTNKIVREPNYYILNEREPNITAIYPKEEILHISHNSRGQWRRDIRNRDTFGIFSIPPIAPLKRMKDWKDNTIIQDKKWKARVIPREHWTVNTEDIIPAMFTAGNTMQEKLQLAQAESQKRIDAIVKVANDPASDQSIVTTNDVESKILEPDSTSYADPNDTINQINEALGSTTGVPQAYLGGKSDGYAGLSSVNAINNVRMEVLVDKIKTGFEYLIRKHLAIKMSGLGKDTIDRIVIHATTISPQLELEMSKVIINYATTGIFDQHELRKMAGYNSVIQNPYTIETNKTDTSPKERTSANMREAENNTYNNTSPKAEVNSQL